MIYNKFLEHYRKFTVGNETPEIMHLWAGLSALAGACEKRIWIPRGPFDLYLNMYVLFVAPAGIGKSTAVDLSADMLDDVGVNVLSGATSKRMIVENMVELQADFTTPEKENYIHSSVTFAADEFNELLDSGGSALLKFLTTIFSSKRDYDDKTKIHGSYKVIRPFLNIIGNMVPEWFGGNLASDLGATGFLARCILVYEDCARGSYAMPIQTDDQVKHREEALKTLLWASTQFGPMRVTEDAEKLFEKWYDSQVISPMEDYRIAQYLERKKRIHLIKVAGLMAIGDRRMTINVTDFKRALHLFEIIETKLRMILLLAGKNKYAQYSNKVMRMLTANNGKMQLTSIANILWADLNLDEIKAVIEQIEHMKQAKRQTIDGKKYLVKTGGKEECHI